MEVRIKKHGYEAVLVRVNDGWVIESLPEVIFKDSESFEQYLEFLEEVHSMVSLE
jgi:hypothetical protein